MPLHLEGMLPKGISDNTLTVLKNGVRSAEPLYASLDETVFHMRKRMKDSLSDSLVVLYILSKLRNGR